MTTHAATMTHAHAEEGTNRGMAGMALFIGSEVMLFGGLFAAYFYLRNQNSGALKDWPPAGIETRLDWHYALLLTVILLSSSLAAHVGMMGIKSNNRSLFKAGIALSMVLGTIFIAGQIYEWFHLFDEGLNAKSGPYGATFFVITGFHGAHVIAGLCMLSVVMLRALWNDFTPSRHVYADAAVLYWHFVDFVWIFVFTVLYLSY